MVPFDPRKPRKANGKREDLRVRIRGDQADPDAQAEWEPGSTP
jgi:hypothetical protein